MQDQAEPVKRRRRAPRDEISDGEFRNITFRAGSRTYNMLVRAANESGYSISEVAERLIESTTNEAIAYQPQDRSTLSEQSEKLLDKISLVLQIYEKSGGSNWIDSAPNRVAANFAVRAIADRLLSIPDGSMDVAPGGPEFGATELQGAATIGLQLGSILADPTDLQGYAKYGRDALPHEKK